VGSIFVSRLSTSLHAAALSLTPLPSPNSSTRYAEPSPRVVMLTLLVVTLPVEIIFLAVLRALGWLHLPFIFVAFSVLFFCCAVSFTFLPNSVRFSYIESSGNHIPYHRPSPNQLPLVKRTRSRYVCPTDPFCPDGLDRSATLSSLF
jgi:hypothetical protein